MSLRTALATTGQGTYDPRGSRDQRIFRELEQLATEIRGHTPAHYLTPISRGVGNLPIGLWVAILDPDVTTSPTRGTYLVYLFDQNRQRVSLSVNQGVTAATAQARKEGIAPVALLRREADAMRATLASTAIQDLEDAIALGSNDLLRKYEAGNIVARTWTLDALPAENALAAELHRFLDLYAEVVTGKELQVLAGSKAMTLPAREPTVLKLRPRERRFEPNDASDYRAHIKEHEEVRSRSHELLLIRLAEWAKARGLEPNRNVYPRDLILHSLHAELLVELKVFPAGRPKHAVRECIGQLFEYQRFYSPGAPLVAALSADPGGAYRDLLNDLGIAVVWPKGGQWIGT
jgi:MrcB-like, N-terminal domain